MDVKTFFQTIDTLFQQEQAKDYHYQRSHIFNKLIEELRSVQSTRADNKIILLYSDLVEFSSLYNGYSSTHRSTMKKDLNTVIETFASRVNTRNLNNVSLYIIYYPQTTQENQRFADFCKVYQEVFKGTGLTIHIGIDHKIPIIHEN
jgi:pyruvate dehydrogenase complex dehydrogenase (E1) component